jgi:hypothetical protein
LYKIHFSALDNPTEADPEIWIKTDREKQPGMVKMMKSRKILAFCQFLRYD